MSPLWRDLRLATLLGLAALLLSIVAGTWLAGHADMTWVAAHPVIGGVR